MPLQDADRAYAALRLSVLSRVVTDAPLESTLDELCRLTERYVDHGVAVVMLLDTDRRRLRLASAPSMSAEHWPLIDGRSVGDASGACGAAVHTGKPVYAADTQLDPRFESVRDLVRQLGVRACWSLPIGSACGSILGTMALLRVETGLPSDEQIELLETCATLAQLAVERARASRQSAFREAIIRTAAEGICVSHAIDEFPFRRLTVWNERMREITGYTMDEVNRLGWSATMHRTEAAQRKALERGRRAFAGENLVGEEWSIVTKDGDERVVAISSSATFTAEGQPAVVWLMQDVTERKQLDARLALAARTELLGRLAGSVAHDFNNLLTAILGQAELALARRDDPATVEASLNAVVDVAQRAARLTRQLLTFARRDVQDPRVLDVNAALEPLRALLDRLVGPAVLLVIEPAAREARVRIDPTRLEQLLVNLALNARDAMPEGGPLLIRTEDARFDADGSAGADSPASGDYVRIIVRDRGCGMTAETAARVFEPFFSTKGLQKGTGIGLTIVQAIVSEARGRLHVQSAPGMGTTISVLLPQAGADAAPTMTRSQPVEPQRGRGERVLVVEDDASVMRTLVHSLGALGYAAVTARGGEEAIQRVAAEQEPIALVLTDVVMPGMSGSELAALLRRQRPSLPIVLMSGCADDPQAVAQAQTGAHEFLAKPFTMDELSRVVGRALGVATGAAD